MVTHMSLSTYVPWEHNPSLPTWEEYVVDPKLDLKNLKDWTNERYNAKYCEVNITMEKYPKLTFFGSFNYEPSSEGAVEDIAMDDFSIDIDGLTVKDADQADDLMLFDLNGRQVASGSGTVTAPASGIYILRIRKPSGTTSVKLRL